VVTAAPKLIGGVFTAMFAYFPPPVVLTGASGVFSATGWAGTGADVSVDNSFVDTGSTSWLTSTSSAYQAYGQGVKGQPSSDQFNRNYSMASREPYCGNEGLQVNDSPNPSYAPFPTDWQAYYDNVWNPGEAGPEQSAVRNSRSWMAVSSTPGPGIDDPGSVKSYPANQVQFDPVVPLSQFSKIRGYSSTVSPLLPPDSAPLVSYEGAWDIYGRAHFPTPNSFTYECMFWTRNHNHNPGDIGPMAESGIDFGDGLLWDLYVQPDTIATGGVETAYSYGIFYLHDDMQFDAGWVNILAGLRYFAKYYVIPSGPGPAVNPLDIPIWQITRGWEPCSSDYSPIPFKMVDFRLDIG
jgi:hypothetical protein